MKRNSILKIICFVLTLCVGTSFFMLLNSKGNTFADATGGGNVVYDFEKPLGDAGEITEAQINELGGYYSGDGTEFGVDVSGMQAYSLRDDYVIYTQDQAQNGLCWSFASSMSLSTTLMIATNQFYDISESWTSLAYANYSSAYTPGSGGTFYYFHNAMNSQGVVYESDYGYEDSYLISKEDKAQLLKYYSKYADKEVMKNVKTVTYSRANNSEQIKNHIYNNGSLYLGTEWADEKLDASASFYYKPPSEMGTAIRGRHAVSIIGWDDNVSVTYDNLTYTGAWICLNSWGNTHDNEGVFYIFYDDMNVDATFQGYTYEATAQTLYYNNIVKPESGYKYTTDLKGEYYGLYTGTTNETKQRNVYFDNNVDITYSYNLSTGANVSGITVIYDGNNVSELFTVNIDEVNKEINVKANNLPTGPYKVLIDYSNGTTEKQHTNIIYVNNGTEVAYLNASTYNSGITNNGAVFTYNSYNKGTINVTVATTLASGSVNLYKSNATYSDNVTLTNSYISYNNLSKTNPVYTATAQLKANSQTKNVYVRVLFVTDSTAQKLVNMEYYLGYGVNSEANTDRMIIDTISGAKIEDPKRDGFFFDGWYYDANYTFKVNNNVLDFASYTIQVGAVPSLEASTYYSSNLKNSNILPLYAKWTIVMPATATLQTTAGTKSVGEQFSITINIEHEYANRMTISNIVWYKEGDSLTGYTDVTITQVINEAGNYAYYATLTVEYQGLMTEITTEVLNIVVLKNISAIIYINQAFTWGEVADAVSYDVELCKLNEDGGYSVTKTETVATPSYKLLENVNVYGDYFVNVSANVSYLGNTYDTEPKSSSEVTVYQVSYVTYTTAQNSKFVDALTAVNNEVPPKKGGYSFLYWCTDEEREIKFVEGIYLSGDASETTLYATWSMDDITIEECTDIIKKYNEVVETVSVTTTHGSGLNNFVYVWYYLPTGSNEWQTLEAQTGNSFTVENVSESGKYYCEISLTDDEGFSVTNNSDNIVVNIEKAPIIINTDEVKKQYTYSGTTRTISSGAQLFKENGFPLVDATVEYTIKEEDKRTDINTFVNVPEDGFLTLIISTAGNANYAPNNVEVRIDILKAKSQININKPFQFFSYTGERIVPEYSIDNTEQIISAYNLPIAVGEHDVILTAPETNNYEEITATVHVTINPANIFIRVHDVSSILFMQAKELTYTLEQGQMHKGDDLQIELHCDVDTSKIGKYAISVTTSGVDSSNYRIAVFEGEYSVTGWPYWIGIGVLLLVVWITIKALNRRRFQYDFETNGGDPVSPIDTRSFKDIDLEIPVREGYKFMGWFLDEGLSVPFRGNFKKGKNKTLYAKWEKSEATEMSLSEELISAQDIVSEIQSIINPKVQQEVNTVEVEELVEGIVKEPTEEEKMQEFLKGFNATTSGANESNSSKEELDAFIKKLTNKD